MAGERGWGQGWAEGWDASGWGASGTGQGWEVPPGPPGATDPFYKGGQGCFKGGCFKGKGGWDGQESATWQGGWCVHPGHKGAGSGSSTDQPWFEAPSQNALGRAFEAGFPKGMQRGFLKGYAHAYDCTEGTVHMKPAEVEVSIQPESHSDQASGMTGSTSRIPRKKEK